MKALKILGVVLLGLVALIVVFAVLVATNLDRAARFGIEQSGTYALGVRTTVGAADVGILSGEFDMSDLLVANPEGFSTPHFLRLDRGGVSFDYGSLTAETIVLPTLTLTGLDVHLDKDEGSSNYQRILDNLKRFETGDAEAPEPDSDVAKQNIVIRRLEIRDIVVHAEVLGGDPVDVVIDEIVLTDVGSEGGDTLELAGVFGVVTKAVMLAAVQAGGQLPGALVQELQSGLSGLTSLSDMGVGVFAEIDGVAADLGNLASDISEGVFKSAEELGRQLEEGARGAQEAIEGAGKNLEDAGKSIEDAAKGIGNILGGKSNDDNGG